MTHAIFISETGSYIKDISKTRSAVNYTDALDNCVPVVLSGLATGQRDLWVAEQATESTDKADIWVVTTPELIYDDTGKTVRDFYNGINSGQNDKLRV